MRNVEKDARIHKQSKKTNFVYFFVFFAPRPSPRGFSRPRCRISSQKLFFWMRICQDIEIFIFLLNFQAVIKSAANAASRKPKSREGRSRGAHDGDSAGGQRPRRAPLELPSLDLGFLEAVLAADLITA